MLTLVYLFVFAFIPPFITANSSGTGDECHYTSPIAWVQGTHKESGDKVKVYFSNDSTAEVVLEGLKDVSVHCEAEYSVEWDFEGYADFRFFASGSGSSSSMESNGTHQKVVQKHTSYVYLVSLKEAYTGLYTCRGRSTQTKNNTIAAYIFVPTDLLFVSPKTAIVSALDQNPVLLPCPIANPKATVRLVKLTKENTVLPVATAEYKHQQGFFVENDPASEKNVSGAYFCIATLDKNVRAVEITVIDGPTECIKKCGENANCETVNLQQLCQCKPQYQQALVSERCSIVCKEDADCPTHMACMASSTDSFLLDLLVEGRNGKATGDKEGECKNPCVYSSTECASNENCFVVEKKPTCLPAQ